MQPFAFAPHATQAVAVAATSVTVTVSASSPQVWVDNRGNTDLLIEINDAPLDANSFRIPPVTSMAVSNGTGTSIYLKRPSGSSSETAYVTSGYGF